MTRTGEREICSVSGRLPDNPGELARMPLCAAVVVRLLCYRIDQVILVL